MKAYQKVSYLIRLIWSAHAVQYSNFFHIAIGEDNPMAHIQITGTRVRMKFVLYGASCG